MRYTRSQLRYNARVAALSQSCTYAEWELWHKDYVAVVAAISRTAERRSCTACGPCVIKSISGRWVPGMSLLVHSSLPSRKWRVSAPRIVTPRMLPVRLRVAMNYHACRTARTGWFPLDRAELRVTLVSGYLGSSICACSFRVDLPSLVVHRALDSQRRDKIMNGVLRGHREDISESARPPS